MMNLSSANRSRYNYSPSYGRSRGPSSVNLSIHSASNSGLRDNFRHWPDPPSAPKRSRTAERKNPQAMRSKRPNSEDTRFRRHISKQSDLDLTVHTLMIGDHIHLNSSTNSFVSDKGDDSIEINETQPEFSVIRKTPNVDAKISPLNVIHPIKYIESNHTKAGKAKQEIVENGKKLLMDTGLMAELNGMTRKIKNHSKVATPSKVACKASQMSFNINVQKTPTPTDIQPEEIKHTDDPVSPGVDMNKFKDPWWLDGQYLSHVNFYLNDGIPLKIAKISGLNIIFNECFTGSDKESRIARKDVLVSQKLKPTTNYLSNNATKTKLTTKDVPTINVLNNKKQMKKKFRYARLDIWVIILLASISFYVVCAVLPDHVFEMLEEYYQPKAKHHYLYGIGQNVMDTIQYFGRILMNIFVHPARPMY